MKRAGAVLPQCILLLFILELFSGPDVFCQTSGQASLIEAAKKEGQVIWYATLNINDSTALLNRFSQKYPFIKTELLRAGSEQLLNRILTEDSAGRSLWTWSISRLSMRSRGVTSCRRIPRRNLPLIRSNSKMRRAIGQRSTIFIM